MDPETVTLIYQAYIDRRMTPEEEKQYLADIQAGKMQSPKHPDFVPPVLNPGIWEAYKSGLMTTPEKVALEKDIADGLWKAPEGEVAEETKPLGILGTIKEQFTGAERTTPEIEALPDWMEMPELNPHQWKGLKAVLGTLATDIPETAQIIKEQFPDIQVRQDAKGNYILKSAMNEQEYAIKPGFRTSDALRAAFVGAAFTPAGRAASLSGQVIGAGLTQTALEAAQAATGGEFDPGMIPMAGAGAGAGFLAGKGIAAVASKAYQRFGKVAPPTIVPEPASLSELAEITRKAGAGSTSAAKALAEQAAPDKEVIEAAQRLGIDEFLQPDHVSTSQSFRELSQAVKSVPGSETRALELQGFEAIAKRADDLIDEIGGVQDLSQLDKTVKSRMITIQSELDAKSEKLFSELNATIAPKTEAPATNLLKFLDDKADELGGVKYLDPLEKKLMQQLAPTKKGVVPTYARIDNIRKKLTAARVRGQGEFKDADVGLIKKLEKELMKDQRAALGVTDGGGIEKVPFGDIPEEVFEPTLVPKTGSLTLYHVTDIDAANKIMKEGFKGGAPNQFQGFESGTQGMYGWSSLSKAKNEIKRAIDHPGGNMNDWAIIEVEVPRKSFNKLVPDEDFGGMNWKESFESPGGSAVVEGDVSNKWIKRIYGDVDNLTLEPLSGPLATFDLARKTVAVRKGVEDDMKSLFGKHLEGTIIGDLSGAVKKLAAGDVSKFVQLLKAVPEDMRQEVVASGLNTAFGKTARNGNLNFNAYANWYMGLAKNRQAYHALMSNLSANSRKQLRDLYKVSNGIRKASRERITTGRLMSVTEQIKGADNAMANIYAVAKRSAGGLAAETITTSVGLPGVGLAAGLASALTRGKTNAIKAADALISSPEFMAMARKGTPSAAAKFAKTPIWKRFFKAVKEPRDLTNPEQWILTAFQTQRQFKEKEK